METRTARELEATMAKNKSGKQKKTSVEGDLRESAHKIWMAGLGALATAEEEGSRLFRTLVDRGQSYESKVRKPVDDAARQMRGTMENVRGRAGKAMRDVEEAVDDRVTSALNRIGVPTRDEVARLTRKVEELNARLNDQSGRSAGKSKTVRKKTAKKRSAK